MKKMGFKKENISFEKKLRKRYTPDRIEKMINNKIDRKWEHTSRRIGKEWAEMKKNMLEECLNYLKQI